MQPLSIFLFALHLCFSIPLLMLFCWPGVPSPLISLLHLFEIIHISQTNLKFHSLVNFSLDLPRELFYLLNLSLMVALPSVTYINIMTYLVLILSVHVPFYPQLCLLRPVKSFSWFSTPAPI